MIRCPLITKRLTTHFPFTTLFRSIGGYGVVARLGSLVLIVVGGVGMGVVGELRRVAGTDVVAAAGVDAVVARPATVRGVVVRLGGRGERRDQRRVVGTGLDGQRIAGEEIGSLAGHDGLVAGAALFMNFLAGVGLGKCLHDRPDA